MDHQLIPFQSVRIRAIELILDNVLAATRKHYNTEPTGTAFDSFVRDVYECFPKQLKYETFYMSTLDAAGKQLTRELIYNLTWRLAGNITKLKNNTIVGPFTTQTELEWCPIKIVKAVHTRGYDGKDGYMYSYRVLAGSPASMKFTTFWSTKYAKFIARSIGFKKTRKVHYKFAHGSELVHMELYVLFDPALSKEDRPGFYHFHVPSGSKNRNLELLKHRYRLYECPLNLTMLEQPCYSCPQGYDSCTAGCHPSTYAVRGCPRCKDYGYFDPDEPNVICIECARKERFQRKS